MADRNDSEERISILREAIEATPDDPSNYYMLGRVYLRIEQYDNAVDAFKQCVESDSDYTAGHRELGRALEKSGQFHEAREVYRQGIHVADQTHDYQTKKEMEVFLTRLEKNFGL